MSLSLCGPDRLYIFFQLFCLFMVSLCIVLVTSQTFRSIWHNEITPCQKKERSLLYITSKMYQNKLTVNAVIFVYILSGVEVKKEGSHLCSEQRWRFDLICDSSAVALDPRSHRPASCRLSCFTARHKQKQCKETEQCAHRHV